MQRRLLEILACPTDKHSPLQLLEFEAKNDIILSGLLICNKCGRFYPIVEEIPIMLPDDLRKPEEDAAFIRKWHDKIPKDLLGGKAENTTSK